MKKILQKLALLIAPLVLVAAFALPASVGAQTKEDICKGVGITGNTTGCTPPAGSPSVDNVVRLVINIMTVIVGVIAVIMIIISGLKYITSGGDSNSVNSAKNTLLYAVVGLVIVALAQVIVRFVLAKTS